MERRIITGRDTIAQMLLNAVSSNHQSHSFFNFKCFQLYVNWSLLLLYCHIQLQQLPVYFLIVANLSSNPSVEGRVCGFHDSPSGIPILKASPLLFEYVLPMTHYFTRQPYPLLKGHWLLCDPFCPIHLPLSKVSQLVLILLSGITAAFFPPAAHQIP